MDNSISLNEPKNTLSMHPKKFALWLFLVSVSMIFAALTSAYIVKQGEGNWLQYNLPSIFWVNTAIIILSSVTMQLAYRSAKRDRISGIKIYMSITSLLGLFFLIGQYYSWTALVDREVFFVGNPSGTFIYVFTGVHALHLISGVLYLIYNLFQSFKLKIHSKKMLNMDMCSTYWHFLGGLWVYLFIFLLINHA